MTFKSGSREERLLFALDYYSKRLPKELDLYIRHFYEINRSGVLASMSDFHRYQGLKSYFIDNDKVGMRQNFYMCMILLKLAREAGFDSNSEGILQPWNDFLFSLLSESPECFHWISYMNLANGNDARRPEFYYHIIQYLLIGDHDSVRSMIEIGAKKCNKDLREKFESKSDFFSLILNEDKNSLEKYIINMAKMKPQNADRDFLHPGAVTHAKICWIKGINVEIDHPLVPMPLMPVAPLDHYEIEYDFLHPGWTPPPPSVFSKIKRWFK